MCKLPFSSVQVYTLSAASSAVTANDNMTHIPVKKYFIISSPAGLPFVNYPDSSLSIIVSSVNLLSDADAVIGF
jgi:hypothetical protein